MLRELRERMQYLMQSTAAQGSSSQAQEAAMASLRAANEDLRKELQSLKADRDQVILIALIHSATVPVPCLLNIAPHQCLKEPTSRGS